MRVENIDFLGSLPAGRRLEPSCFRKGPPGIILDGFGQDSATFRVPFGLPTRFHAVFNKEPRHVKFPTVLTDEHLPSCGGAGYLLRSVVVHHGDAYGGHYTTFALSDDSGWYDYNDARSPRKVSSQEVAQSQASLLFYEHR